MILISNQHITNVAISKHQLRSPTSYPPRRPPLTSVRLSSHLLLRTKRQKIRTYLVRSSSATVSPSSNRSALTISESMSVRVPALEKPCPNTFQFVLSRSKALRTWRPRRPVAPVIRAVRCMFFKFVFIFICLLVYALVLSDVDGGWKFLIAMG